MKRIKQYLENNFEDEKILLEYQKTKDENIRNELINQYIPVAERVTKNYCENKNIEYNEIIGYAYEGLLLAFEDYDSNLKTDFYRYACSRMYQYLDKGYMEVKYGCFMKVNCIKKIEKTIEATEKEYESKLYDNFSLIDIIIKKIFLETNLDNMNEKELRTFISMYLVPLNINDDKYDISYNDQNIAAYHNITKNVLNKFIKKIPHEHQEILNYLLGFKDGRCYTLKEIAEIKNCSVGAITHLKSEIYKRLAGFNEVEKLRGFFEIYDTVDSTNYSLTDNQNNETETKKLLLK